MAPKNEHIFFTNFYWYESHQIIFIQAVCTGVVQLFVTEAPHVTWLKKRTGVLCFTKDNARKSYFLQLFCLTESEQIWEHEMYVEIVISRPTPFLLVFEGQVKNNNLNWILW